MREGRVIFGLGLGYREIEYRAFGVSRKNGPARMVEGFELIKRRWTKDEVTFAGTFFRVTKETCTNRPVQKPYPPIWIAVNADAVVKRTARLGYQWFVNMHAPLATIERQCGFSTAALARAGHQMPVARPITVELHVTPTWKEAVATARPFLSKKYQAYADWGQDEALPGEEPFRVGCDELGLDRFILGSPEDVIEQLEGRVEQLEASYFMLRVGWPGMEIHKVLRILELMGEDALPHCHKKYGRVIR